MYSCVLSGFPLLLLHWLSGLGDTESVILNRGFRFMRFELCG